MVIILSLSIYDEVVQINNFRIYDRWGNMVYYQENLTPQDRNKFWDGKFAGNQPSRCVYVYRVDLTYADGSSELKAGDVTLIRIGSNFRSIDFQCSLSSYKVILPLTSVLK